MIDAHNHVGGPDRGDRKAQTAAEMVEALDAAGMDQAVIFPFNNPDPTLGFKAANDYIAQAVSAFPARLIGFGRVDPTHPDRAVAEIGRIKNELGLSGIKLHPIAQDFRPDHPGLHRVMEKIADLEMIVVFDSGSRWAPWPEMAELARRFPETPMIMAHMKQEGYIEAAMSAPNIYLGTTKVPPEAIIDAVRRIGSERIISGSDSPYVSPSFEIEKIKSLDLPESDKDHMLGLNMARLLKLEPLSS